MKVIKVSHTEWKELATEAHAICFNEIRPPEMNRVDFVLLGLHNDKPCGYITFHELDSESVYLGHGGVFPNIEKSIRVMDGYNFGIKYAKENYKNIFTYIENENVTMLKMAMSVGFRLVGIKLFKGKVFAEMFCKGDV